MNIIRHGVFATPEEVIYIKSLIGKPLIAYTNPAPPGPGVPHAIPMFESPQVAAHRAALAHGLPEITGYYGIDLSNNEFVEAKELL